MNATWIVQVNRSILGPIVIKARPKGGKYRPARALPTCLRQYLNLPADLGKRAVMGDFKTVEDLDQLTLDDNLLKRTWRGGTRWLTIVLPASQLPPARPRVPRGVPAVRNLRQLCAYFSADEPSDLNRRIYKGTSCGASISLRLAGGEWLHNGRDGWNTLPITAKIEGFTIQTIVEGSDATVDSDTFYLPVRKREIAEWMTEMEAQASAIWEQANSDESLDDQFNND